MFCAKVIGECGNILGESDRYSKSLATQEILIVIQAIDLIIGIKGICAIDGNIRGLREKTGGLSNIWKPE